MAAAALPPRAAVSAEMACASSPSRGLPVIVDIRRRSRLIRQSGLKRDANLSGVSPADPPHPDPETRSPQPNRLRGASTESHRKPVPAAARAGRACWCCASRCPRRAASASIHPLQLSGSCVANGWVSLVARRSAWRQRGSVIAEVGGRSVCGPRFRVHRRASRGARSAIRGLGRCDRLSPTTGSGVQIRYGRSMSR